MVTEAADLSSKSTFQLVEFVFTGGAFRATDLDSDYEFDGFNYSSIPDMEVKLPANTGTLENTAECLIALPSSAGFVADYTSGIPHQPATVKIIEILVPEEGAAPSNINTLFKGLVVVGRRNPGGRPGRAVLAALPLKARLDVALGEPCNHQCTNRLGNAACTVDLTILDRTKVITVLTILGTKITCNPAQIPTGLVDRLYHRGFVHRNGLYIGVQEWRNEVFGTRSEFFLCRQPPASWLNQTVTLVAGCAKDPDSCNLRFANLANYNGRGFAIPPYHPNYEDAP